MSTHDDPRPWLGFWPENASSPSIRLVVFDAERVFWLAAPVKQVLWPGQTRRLVDKN